MSKQALSTAALLFLALLSHASPKYSYVDARSVTCINKPISTRNPYHRLDADKYAGMTKGEQEKCRLSCGLAFAFETDSQIVGVRVEMLHCLDGNISAANAMRGFDLYQEQGGEWLWAGSNALKRDVRGESQEIVLSTGLAKGEKRFILYCPLVAELSSLEIFVSEGCRVTPSENPFRHRVAVWGSSFTQGAGCSRCGMLYTAQLSRMTGINFINLGFSGRCRLQQYFADALIDCPVDAYVIDGFSNPPVEEIQERLFPFIERFQKEKPGVPLIFLKTIYRENRLARPDYERKEQRREEVADSLMKIAVKKYRDVYWVTATNATGKYHECTTDGTHPGDHGYTLWAESIEKPVTKILKRYGIR